MQLWHRPKIRTNYLFLYVCKNMHSGATQKAPPLFSLPEFSCSSVSLSLRRQKSELKGRSLASTGRNKQRELEGAAQTERLVVYRRGPGGPQRAPADPSGLLLNVG